MEIIVIGRCQKVGPRSPGEGEDWHKNETPQQRDLFVHLVICWSYVDVLDGDIDDHDVMISKNLCEGGEERLKAGKMANQLKSWAWEQSLVS